MNDTLPLSWKWVNQDICYVVSMCSLELLHRDWLCKTVYELFYIKPSFGFNSTINSRAANQQGCCRSHSFSHVLSFFFLCKAVHGSDIANRGGRLLFQSWWDITDCLLLQRKLSWGHEATDSNDQNVMYLYWSSLYFSCAVWQILSKYCKQNVNALNFQRCTKKSKSCYLQSTFNQTWPIWFN